MSAVCLVGRSKSTGTKPQGYTENSKMIYGTGDQNERAEKARTSRRETIFIIDSKVTHLFNFRK